MTPTHNRLTPAERRVAREYQQRFERQLIFGMRCGRPLSRLKNFYILDEKSRHIVLYIAFPARPDENGNYL